MASIALGVMGALGAAGAIGSSAIQANAAGNAAATQEQAAAAVTQQAKDAATAAQGDVNSATGLANTTLSSGLSGQEALLSPYIQAGTSSLGQLQTSLTGLTAPGSQFNFNPTTSPQLQFEQQQAQQALQRQAAASGTVLGGGEDRASDIMNTGLASTYLNQAFNQSLAQYNTNRQNTLTQIQGLTNLTGLGYNATGAATQAVGNTAAAQAANQIQAGMYSGQTGLQAAQIAEGATTGAANANSANSIAQGNIWGNAASNLAGGAASLYGLSQAPNMGSVGPGISPSTGQSRNNSDIISGTNSVPINLDTGSTGTYV